ncbi:MAG: serine/threonine protein kinase, partial [Candidatus Hydrogenedentes bacterium]|nr:serine/threonine protein kinase [Candidatus Hydrogenedentota bacterium]
DEYVDDMVRAHGDDSQAALASIHQARTIQNSIEGMYNTLQGTTIPPDIDGQSTPRRLDIFSTESLPTVEEAPGRYTHPSEYARGGVGRVLLVHDQHLGRDIALKELLPNVQFEGSTVKAGEQTPIQASLSLMTRFLQEARITGQLEHPSIVPVYELGRRKDGTIYYTMKLVRGTTLTASLKKGGNLEERLKLLPNFLDLCHAIGYAHSRGIIHRDIKPNNVMIGEFGETVVLDWGLAKIRGQEDAHAGEMEQTLRSLKLLAEAKAVETANGQVLGTPVFMPPEQARGEIDAITERSDVYALGAVLYSILTGQFPYSGRNASEVLRKVMAHEPAPVESIEPHAPPELVAICRRAMHRNAEKRYADGKEVAEEISRFLSGALVGAYEYGFTEHLRRFVQRHKAALSAAAACLVALTGFAAFSYIQIAQERNAAVVARDNEEAQRTRAERELYISNVQLARHRTEERRFELADRLLDAAPEPYRNWEWDYLKRLCHQDVWTFRGHSHIVEDVSLSADGSTLLTTSDDGTVRVVDAATGEERRVLAHLDALLMTAPINGPGTRAVVLGSDGSVMLCDVSTGESIARLEGHVEVVRVARFSADGQWLLTASFDGLTQRWDSETGQKVWATNGQPLLNDAVISPDGRYIAEAGMQGPVILMNADNGTIIKTAEVQPAPLNKLVFSPDGKRLAGAHGRSLTVLAVPDLTQVTTVEPGSGDVMAAVFSADGTRLAAGMEDGAAGVWDAATGAKLATLEGHQAAVTGMAFFGKDGTVLTSSRDHTLRIWAGNSGAELRVLEGHSGPIRGMSFHEELGSAWTASEDHTVKKWNVHLDANAARTVLHGHTRSVCALAFAPGERALLSVSRDGMARVWDPALQHSLWTLQQEENEILCASWSPDGTQIATGASDSTVRIWNVQSQAEEHRLSRHGGPVSAIFYNPEKRQILSISWDNTAILWDSENGELIYQKETLWGKRGLGAFSPDGTHLALITGAQEVSVMDTVSGTPSVTLMGHRERITSLAFSPDSGQLLTTSLDKTARVWNVGDGTPAFILEGHATEVSCGAFAPDGTRIATGTIGGPVYVWDAATGELQHTAEGHTSAVLGLAFTEDSSRLFSFSEYGSIRLWNPEDKVEMLRFDISREFEGDEAFAYSGRKVAATWQKNGIVVFSPGGR